MRYFAARLALLAWRSSYLGMFITCKRFLSHFKPLFTLNLPCKITVRLTWQCLPALSLSRHRWPDRWMETCSKLLLIWPTQEQRAKREKIKTGEKRNRMKGDRQEERRKTLKEWKRMTGKESRDFLTHWRLNFSPDSDMSMYSFY